MFAIVKAQSKAVLALHGAAWSMQIQCSSRSSWRCPWHKGIHVPLSQVNLGCSPTISWHKSWKLSAMSQEVIRIWQRPDLPILTPLGSNLPFPSNRRTSQMPIRHPLPRLHYLAQPYLCWQVMLLDAGEFRWFEIRIWEMLEPGRH